MKPNFIVKYSRTYLHTYAFAFDSLKLGKGMNGSSKFLNKKVGKHNYNELSFEMGNEFCSKFLGCATDCKV